MSDQGDMIAKVCQEEDSAAKMLDDEQRGNDRRITEVLENASKKKAEAEEKAKEKGQSSMQKAKEQGKEEYKKIIAEMSNQRRVIAEGGRLNVGKGAEHVIKTLFSMFE